MFFQVCVDTIVIGDVEQLRVSIASTSKVIVNTMQNFMSKQELNFFGFEHFNKTGIVVEIATVCCGSRTPFVGVY